MPKDWTGNYHSMCVIIGAHNECKEDREINDYYATQPLAAELLCDIEHIDKNVWECACGEGHLSKVFTERGHNVKSTDLIDRGYGTGGIDFLKCTEQYDGDIVTNPPYKYALEFCKHALDIVTVGHKVCMFLRMQFLEGKERRKFFDEYPPRTVWISTSRIHCGKNGVFTKSNMAAYGWYVWEKGYTGNTELKWFN